MAHQYSLQQTLGLISSLDYRTEAVLENVEDRLRRSSYLELRRIECSFRNGVLTLMGHVSSYYLRQMAQVTLQGMPDVYSIENQLEVLSVKKVAISEYGIGN